MSTSASSASTPAYDVFLSHRGLKMKKRFANTLYHTLKDRGICAFLDMEELSKGEDVREPMMEAVRSAKINVPIFTNDYGTSSWCLDELAEMMKRKQNNQAKVIPIYYNLKPEDLRIEEGASAAEPEVKRLRMEEGELTGKSEREKGKEFASQLERFLKDHTYDTQRVKGWKDALREASWLEGFRMQTYADCEGKLISAVAAKIQFEIEDSLQVEMPVVNAVGVGCKAEELGQRMHLHDDRTVYVLLLLGMGGIGKTTLARAVYNRYRKEFQEKSFVESCGSQKPIDIQNRLRKDLLRRNNDGGDDMATGRECLRRGLLGKKVLIVLDDVKAFKSVEMVIDVKSLYRGSRILLTSRDSKAFPHPNDFAPGAFDGEIYQVEEMETKDSLQLFCLHAFRKPYADPGFDTIAERVVKACGGIPLALEVLGEHLRSIEDKGEWEEAIDELRHAGHEGISSSLKMSYDALKDGERQMFQDVACFFVGELEWQAMHYWKNSIPNCKTCLRKLTQLCLVKVNESNELTMHDLLKDLGRKIGRDSKTRVCDDDELERLLGNGQDLDQLCGLATSLPSLDASVLCRMRSLQLLFLRGTRLNGLQDELERLKLIWLRWEFPSFISTLIHDSSALRIPWKNLALLELSSSLEKEMVRLWQPYSSGLRMMLRPPITKLREPTNQGKEISLWKGLGSQDSMEVLEFTDFEKMVELPFSFGELRSLRKLSIDRCYSLEKLPSSLGELKKLRQMYICSCDQLEELPQKVGSLEILEELHAKALLSITKLPSSLGGLKMLRKLIIAFCWELKELPQNIGCLESLEELHVYELSSITELPSSLGGLKKLRKLNISKCRNLKELPQNLGNLESLEELDVSSLYSIIELPPSLGSLKRLRKLYICMCEKLKELPQNIDDLESVEDLCANSLHSITELPSSFGSLKKLRKLDISRCMKLKELPQNFGHLESLEELDASGLDSIIEQHSSLGNLKKHCRLKIFDCQEPKEVPQNLSRLESFNSLRLEPWGETHLCERFFKYDSP